MSVEAFNSRDLSKAVLFSRDRVKIERPTNFSNNWMRWREASGNIMMTRVRTTEQRRRMLPLGTFTAFCTAIFCMSFPTGSSANEFWTVKAEGGVMSTMSGTVAINIGSYQPTNPNPAGTPWVACQSGWIYFHKKADGTLIDPVYVDRMLSIALTSFKTGSKLRVSLDRDASGKCYSSQMYDQGAD